MTFACLVRTSFVLVAALGQAACTSSRDTVFSPLSVSFQKGHSQADEGQGEVEIVLELNVPSTREVRVALIVQDGTATSADDCKSRDYSVESSQVVFEPGETTTSVVVRHLEDDIHEADETLILEIESVTGAATAEPSRHVHSLIDDDRSALLDVVQDFGALGNGRDDDTRAIQNAMDRARLSDRAVVFFPPGRYLLETLHLSPGVTYAGDDAVLVLAPGQPTDARLLSFEYSGDEDSPRTLITGLTLDGNREEQGKFDEWEFQESELLFARGDPERKGRARLVLEGTRFQYSGGSGVILGTNSDTQACRLTAEEVFTDLLKLAGGNSRLELVGLRAGGSVGTTGMAITGWDPGYEDSRVVDVVLQNLDLRTGDLELDVQDGSQVVASNVTMGTPPIFIRAVRSKIVISDSDLQVGVSQFRDNRFVAPSEVLFENCDITVSEMVSPGEPIEEAERRLVVAPVTWNDVRYGYAEGEADTLVETMTDQSVVFEGCRFHVADNVEASDQVYVVSSVEEPVDPSQALVLRNCSFDPEFDEIVADGCGPCTVQ